MAVNILAPLPVRRQRVQHEAHKEHLRIAVAQAVNPQMGEPRAKGRRAEVRSRRHLFHFTVNPNFLLYAVK
jgi:hypothetical protein